MATFTSLPAELRIQIWQYSLPEPRNLVLSWSNSGKTFTSNMSPPNLAHVCHDSRKEFAKHYELAFGLDPLIWFSFDRDVLYVTDEAFAELDEATLKRVKKLRHFRYTGAMALKCSS